MWCRDQAEMVFGLVNGRNFVGALMTLPFCFFCLIIHRDREWMQHRLKLCSLPTSLATTQFQTFRFPRFFVGKYHASRKFFHRLPVTANNLILLDVTKHVQPSRVVGAWPSTACYWNSLTEGVHDHSIKRIIEVAIFRAGLTHTLESYLVSSSPAMRLFVYLFVLAVLRNSFAIPIPSGPHSQFKSLAPSFCPYEKCRKFCPTPRARRVHEMVHTTNVQTTKDKPKRSEWAVVASCIKDNSFLQKTSSVQNVMGLTLWPVVGRLGMRPHLNICALWLWLFNIHCIWQYS